MGEQNAGKENENQSELEDEPLGEGDLNESDVRALMENLSSLLAEMDRLSVQKYICPSFGLDSNSHNSQISANSEMLLSTGDSMRDTLLQPAAAAAAHLLPPIPAQSPMAHPNSDPSGVTAQPAPEPHSPATLSNGSGASADRLRRFALQFVQFIKVPTFFLILFHYFYFPFLSYFPISQTRN